MYFETVKLRAQRLTVASNRKSAVSTRRTGENLALAFAQWPSRLATTSMRSSAPRPRISLTSYERASSSSSKTSLPTIPCARTPRRRPSSSTGSVTPPPRPRKGRASLEHGPAGRRFRAPRPPTSRSDPSPRHRLDGAAFRTYELCVRPSEMTGRPTGSNHSRHEEFEGATVFVTGGSRGIGKAIALRFADLGAARVGIGYLRNDRAAEETAEEL